MKATPCAIPDVVLIEPRLFEDERGFFYESFNHAQFVNAIGRSVRFVQDNHSKSARHVLRGLHYQKPYTQGKLVRVLAGEVFDVAVDLRKDSAHFGKWVGMHLSSDTRRQLWVPEGFAHGFLVLSETAEVLYKTTDYYSPDSSHCIRWDDPTLAIDWPLEGATPILSPKDQQGVALADAPHF